MDVISRYLKYGDSIEFTPSGYVEQMPYTWEDAKQKFRHLFEQEMDSYTTDSLAFSGNYLSCAMLDYSNPITTWSLKVKDPMKVSKMLNGIPYHQTIDLDNLETILFKINELWDEPRCSIGDLFSYIRHKHMKENGKRNMYCEGGLDWLLFGSDTIYTDVMRLALKRKEYSLVKAFSYLGNATPNTNFGNCITTSYMDEFYKNQIIFNDNDLIDFGLPPVTVRLEKDNISHFTKAINDWGYVSVYERRVKRIGKEFGVESFAPFTHGKSLVDFCMSLPIEMKFCLGNAAHILRQTFQFSNEIKNQMITRVWPSLYKLITPKAKSILNKYLVNIYRVLPKDKVNKHLHDKKKLWHLMNLAIWLEIHGYEGM